MTTPASAAAPVRPVRAFTDIPGWFFWIDRLLFGRLLEAQRDSPPGVLVELGTYLGKSAVVIGDYLRTGERFVALDLFGRLDLLAGESPDPATAATTTARTTTNGAEVRRSYPTLTRPAFEANYLALHAELPDIVEGLSSTILTHVRPGTARFVHVDASHLYAAARVDAGHTRTMLRPDGIAVFDDWRSEHTPGVSAAVWEAVFTAGLIPLALTPYKFYGVYSQPELYREAIAELVRTDPAVWAEQVQIAGHPVLRLKLRDRPVPANQPATTEAVARPVVSAATRWSRSVRRLLVGASRRAGVGVGPRSG